LLRVARVASVTPGLVSVTLAGDELASFPEHCPAAHVKLFLPRAGQPRPALPTLGPDGPVWPANAEKPIVRTYSVRSFRPQAREIDIEFAVHGVDGPATAFAKGAQPGDYVGLSYPGGPDPMIPPARCYVLAGDMSALPAIASILEHLPRDAHGAALIRVDDAADVRPLAAPEGVAVRWFEAGPEGIDAIVGAFKSVDTPTEASHFWIGGEHALVVALRRHLVKERGIAKDALYALPYWRHRFSEEGYHDTRDDVMSSED